MMAKKLKRTIIRTDCVRQGTAPNEEESDEWWPPLYKRAMEQHRCKNGGEREAKVLSLLV
jgi:hypothetical protein